MNKQCTNCPGRTDHLTGDGKPVLMVRTKGSVCWEEVGAESYEFCQQDGSYECRTLYAARDSGEVRVPRELLADLVSRDHDTRIQAERRMLAMLANQHEQRGGE